MTNKDHKIKAVIFDLGRVLVNLDFDPLVKKLFPQTANMEDAFELFEQLRREGAILQFGRGEIEPVALHAEVCSKCNLEMSYDEFVSLWCNVFSPKEDMLAIVRRLLDRRGAAVGILSDTDQLHWKYIKESYPILACVRRPTLSFEVGAIKPDARIYKAAAENVGVPIANCLFFDDLEYNVEGAQKAGMRAFTFRSAQQVCNVLIEAGLL